MSTEEITTEFVVNQTVFYLALVISVGTVLGFGFQGFRWLRKKQAMERANELEAMNKLVDERAKTVTSYLEKMEARLMEQITQKLSEVMIKLENVQGQINKHDYILKQHEQWLKELRGKGEKESG